eukprot:7360617-Pyramimonas_sp.AAC.1
MLALRPSRAFSRRSRRSESSRRPFIGCSSPSWRKKKPKGGLRPVLLCAAPVRLSEKARRPMVQDFEARHPRRHWAFGAGKPAEHT